MPTGSSTVPKAVRATRSAASTSSDPARAAGTRVSGARTRRRATGRRGRRRTTPGPATAVATAAQPRRPRRARRGSARPARPVARAVSSPSCRPRSGRASSRTAGTSTAQATRQGDDVVPAAAVERAGQPQRRPLHVVDLGAGEQELRERRAHRGDADADQHEPVGGQPVAVGEQVDRGRGEQPADEGRDGTAGARPGRAPAPATMTATAAVVEPAVMPMMSGLASGLRARLWNTAPDSPNRAPTAPRPARAAAAA